MASEDAPVGPDFYNYKIYKWYTFTPDVLKIFTIDKNATVRVQKEEWERLREIPMYGKCRSCKYASAQKPKNTSNWTRHLEKIHPDEYVKYKKLMESYSRKKRDRSPASLMLPSNQRDSDSNPSKRPRQESIVDALHPDNIAKKKNKVEQDKKLPKEVQDRINFRAFQLIVAEALALRLVESVYFRNYSKEIDSRVVVFCTKSLKLLIGEEFIKFKCYIRSEFQLAVYVCLTADIWGAKNRSFIGITAHWLTVLSNGSIERKSAAIACQRFEGSHTHDKIAEIIKKVMDDYCLPLFKVSHIVTDNGANFVKSFKQFSAHMAQSRIDAAAAKLAQQAALDARATQDMLADDCGARELSEVTALLDELDGEEDPLDPSLFTEAASLKTSAFELLQKHYESEKSRIVLPDHIRCASHTLDLIAKKDTDLSKFDAKGFTKKNAFRQAWTKLSGFWNKIGQSISASEKSQAAFGVALPTPCATRWNTYFDCITAFLKHQKNLKGTNDLLQSIGLSSFFTKEDIELLQEYSELMKPLAYALDIFQGQNNCFLGIGMVLPILTRIKNTLKKRCFPNLGPMRERIIEKIDDRFGHLFHEESYLIAAATHPFFKTKWMTPDAARSAKAKLKQLVSEASTPVHERSQESLFEDFFQDEDNRSENEVDLDEVDLYLRDKDQSIQMLDTYPQIKTLFVKYNTSIPTSAPVERLFSTAAIVLTVRRNRLSDKLLEMLILLKIHLKLDSESIITE